MCVHTVEDISDVNLQEDYVRYVGYRNEYPENSEGWKYYDKEVQKLVNEAKRRDLKLRDADGNPVEV